MQAQQRVLRGRQLTLSQQPSFIANGQACDLFRQFQLQLLASLTKGGTELKKMPLNQAGRSSVDQNWLPQWTDASLAQKLRFLGSISQGISSAETPLGDGPLPHRGSTHRAMAIAVDRTAGRSVGALRRSREPDGAPAAWRAE